MAKPIVIGNQNSVVPGTEDIQAIFCEGQNFSPDDEGYNYIQNKQIRLTDTTLETETVTIHATVSLTKKTETASFIAGDNAYNIYFVDATAGNIAVTLEATHMPIWFVRLDGTANTVTITPNTGGNINGAGSYGLNVQYEKINVISDGVDFYF